MKKNYFIGLKIDKELDELIEKTINKINLSSNLEIKKSDFARICLKRICLEIVTNDISKIEFLFNDVKPK